MHIKSQKLIWFSPTGTTKKIITAVGDGIGAASSVLDITLPTGRTMSGEITEDLVVIGAPVYVGGIPPLGAQYLTKLAGNGKPAVLIVVYGNRAYENALTEMKEACRQASLIPAAAGAFLAEHSFADAGCPIANGRPDAADLALAHNFGRQVAAKLSALPNLDGMSGLSLPEAVPMKAKMTPRPPFGPETGAQCTRCGICVAVCPTAAIDRAQPELVKATACLRCYACIRICPQGAKQFTDASFQEHIGYLSQTYREAK